MNVSKKVNVFLFLCLTADVFSLVFAQNKLPIINATSNLVDLKDGNNFHKGSWTITPEAKPDVLISSSKEVVFYTDIDSIKIKVKQDVNWKFDFIENQNNQDYLDLIMNNI
jgi:hypothetical protein